MNDNVLFFFFSILFEFYFDEITLRIGRFNLTNEEILANIRVYLHG